MRIKEASLNSLSLCVGGLGKEDEEGGLMMKGSVQVTQEHEESSWMVAMVVEIYTEKQKKETLFQLSNINKNKTAMWQENGSKVCFS